MYSDDASIYCLIYPQVDGKYTAIVNLDGSQYIRENLVSFRHASTECRRMLATIRKAIDSILGSQTTCNTGTGTIKWAAAK